MEKKRILFVTQEMKPYTELGEMSDIVNQITQYVSSNGYEIRVLMPRFGTINERRHRLHEVVRLSGMNIIVDDDDYPLIIKVASLPGSRMQVYFLDNEEFFKRKQIFADAAEKQFDDNLDRMVFYCKGSIETVKKFGWVPDIIHCHGWMTSLIPLYLRTTYKDEPIFRNAKIIYSLYQNDLEMPFDKKFLTKASINNLDPKKLEDFYSGKSYKLHQGAIKYADALISGSEKLDKDVLTAKKSFGKKPQLDFIPQETRNSVYLNFYETLLK
ncbi:MAG: glycogen/starch synthase [Saprospiraceae bacterium]|nr:glycogen/starch synthase [Saprospiraceae bacterium]